MTNHQTIIDHLAAPQRGLVTAPQLADAGLSRRQIDRLLHTGRLVRIGARVCRLGGLQLDARARTLAACLDTGAYASHATSAWLHAVSGFGAPRTIEVLRSGGHGVHESRLARVHTTTWLPGDDVGLADGIPCTSVARTLFALAASVPAISYDRVKGAVDDAVRQRLATDPWLWWRLEELRCRGRNGVSVLERILVERSGGKVTESWLEREALRVFADGGLPQPVCQARINKRGAFLARVDFAYHRLRIIIEVTGAVAHSTPAQRAADARRRNELLMQGYLVLEFTYEQIVHEPAAVIAQVRAALALRRSA